MDARQFNGILGTARSIAAWCGEGKACAGGTLRVRHNPQTGEEETYEDDALEGGLNIMEPETYVNEAGVTVPTFKYIDVNATDWVVLSDDGELHVFTDKQFKMAFPTFVPAA